MLVDVVRTDGHCEVVRLLLEAGANSNIHNALLVTPLHLAALGEFTAHQTPSAAVISIQCNCLPEVICPCNEKMTFHVPSSTLKPAQ